MSNRTFNQFLLDLAEKQMTFYRYLCLRAWATPFQREILDRWIELHAK